MEKTLPDESNTKTLYGWTFQGSDKKVLLLFTSFELSVPLIESFDGPENTLPTSLFENLLPFWTQYWVPEPFIN